MKKNQKWTNRDWFWLVGILIGIMIIMIASFFNNESVEINFSIISSAVSIALALVAIFIALKQDSDNQKVNFSVSNLLNEIAINLRNVDEKVNKMDSKVFKDIAAETIKEYTEENNGKESFTKDEVKEMLNGLSSELIKEINIELNRNKNSTPIKNINNYEDDKQIYMLIENFRELSVNEIQKKLSDLYNIQLSKASIARYLNQR